MSLDLAKLHRWIVAELGRGRPIEKSMSALIDKCEKSRPHVDWSKLRELPYSDLQPLEDWIRRVFSKGRSRRPLKGLWFGLFNPCPDGRHPVAEIYVCGSDRFDPDPEDNSWAVGPKWWPKGRYAESKILADLYRISYRQRAGASAQKDCLGNDAEYPLCLGYGLFAVKKLLEKMEPALILGKSDSIGVAVGFDSGDFVLVGRMTKDGLLAF